MTVVKRSFNPDWFDCYKWLHYDEAKDAAFAMFVNVQQTKKAESEPQGRRFHLQGISELEGWHSQFVKA